MENSWTMEEAQSDFTAIAEAVYAGRPQYVTNHSHPDLVIITKTRYEELKGEERDENRRFIQFLMSIPKGEPFYDENESGNITARDREF